MNDPLLTRTAADGPTTAAILLLHGGKQRSRTPVGARSASWRRMRALQSAIAAPAASSGVATWLLRYRERGWNDPSAPSPVPDARWALAQLRAELGDIPVVLLGHSMGARTAVHVADEPNVTAVVGLAPWLTDSDPAHTLAGRTIQVAHGSADRITSARATQAYIRKARGVAGEATYTDMGPVGHYMLRNVPAWNSFALRESLAALPLVR